MMNILYFDPGELVKIEKEFNFTKFYGMWIIVKKS